jgi:hypothetical protein
MVMKKLFFIIPILFSVQSFSQKVLTSDNKKLDSLTSSFKTYSFTLMVNDSVLEHRLKWNMILELQRSYSFLKKKKLKSGESDFTILINIKGEAIGSLDYEVSSKWQGSAHNYYHQYTLDHVVSASLVVSNRATDLIIVDLGSDVTVRRKYSYIEKVDEYRWYPDQTKVFGMQLRDKNAAIIAREGLSEIWEFEKDFFEVFNIYKTWKF